MGAWKMSVIIPQRRKTIDTSMGFLNIIPDDTFHGFTIEDIDLIYIADVIMNKLLPDVSVKSFH